MKNGNLVISLDFELIWGVFDKVNPEDKRAYFSNTVEVIPEILKLFTHYEIRCTWATVGMLFNRDWEEWLTNVPKILPEYSNKQLSAYDFGKQFSKYRNSQNFCFAPALIKSISATPFQEIGTHTYSHYYCQEEGQTPTGFKADMEMAVSLAHKNNIVLKSLVFPRNQFNPEYLKICQDLGIENVRSNPGNWYWQNSAPNSLISKIFRTADAYIGLNDKAYNYNQQNKSKFSIQMSSRFLRPYTPNGLLNTLKLARIKSEMRSAAKENKIYHLWWHPHNFGDHPEESLKDLQELLEFFCKCKKQYNFQSSNMQEISRGVF